MNEIVVPDVRGSPTALLPTNMQEAFQLAKIMATIEQLPKELHGKPGACLMVIEQAMRWGMSPFAVAQETHFIRNRIMHSGKICAAAINTRSNLTGRLQYKFEGSGETRKVTVIGHIRGEAEPREVEVELKNASTGTEQWKKQEDQQLAYHGSRIWGRRYVPEVMLGVYSPEEMPVEDDRPKSLPAPEQKHERPQVARVSRETSAPQAAVSEAGTVYDLETGEVVQDKSIPDAARAALEGDDVSWLDPEDKSRVWVEGRVGKLKGIQKAATLLKWLESPDTTQRRMRLKQEAPAVAETLEAAIIEAEKRLLPQLMEPEQNSNPDSASESSDSEVIHDGRAENPEEQTLKATIARN